jgi:hypothetical protein
MIFFHPCHGVVQRVLTAGFYSYFQSLLFLLDSASVSYPSFLQIVEVAVGDIWGLRPMVLFFKHFIHTFIFSYFHTALLFMLVFDNLIF